MIVLILNPQMLWEYACHECFRFGAARTATTLGELRQSSLRASLTAGAQIDDLAGSFIG
jgi:hypothetical protein